GVTCNMPQANSCDPDGQHLRVYNATGTCSAGGACSYASTLQLCQFGCANGACKNDPCAGVTCDQPQANSCDPDGQHLRVYNPTGTCSAGSCSYASTLQLCQFGCAN